MTSSLTDLVPGLEDQAAGQHLFLSTAHPSYQVWASPQLGRVVKGTQSLLHSSWLSLEHAFQESHAWLPLSLETKLELFWHHSCYIILVRAVIGQPHKDD